MSSACTPSDTTIRAGMLLRQAREQAGITQRELAERLGCSQPAISQAEAGGASLSVATLHRFADALGCDLQLAIVSREVTLKHVVAAAFRRPQHDSQETQERVGESAREPAGPTRAEPPPDTRQVGDV